MKQLIAFALQFVQILLRLAAYFAAAHRAIVWHGSFTLNQLAHIMAPQYAVAFLLLFRRIQGRYGGCLHDTAFVVRVAVVGRRPVQLL